MMTEALPKKVLIVSPSSARQRIYQFDNFELGSVNRTLKNHECFSGKGVNVARVFSCLKLEADLITLIHKDELSQLRGELDGINVHPVYVDEPTRTCATLLSSGVSTEIVEEPKRLKPEKCEEFFEKVFAYDPALRPRDYDRAKPQWVWKLTLPKMGEACSLGEYFLFM